MGEVVRKSAVFALVERVPCFSLIVSDFNKIDFNYLGSLALQISPKTQVSLDFDMYIFVNTQFLGNAVA
jgi:hypothetical protein